MTFLCACFDHHIICRDHLPAAMRWGQEMEGTARAGYIAMMESNGQPVNVTPTGLTLSQTMPYLGASTDGKVEDRSMAKPNGILEVKCPYSMNKIDIRNSSVQEIVDSGQGNRFYVGKSESGFSLKHDSDYYSQVQGEMALTGAQWCDFVVWTKVDTFVERIKFDAKFWEDVLLPKLKLFYGERILPLIESGQIGP